jgi:hypothetical protein
VHANFVNFARISSAIFQEGPPKIDMTYVTRIDGPIENVTATAPQQDLNVTRARSVRSITTLYVDGDSLPLDCTSTLC